MKKLSSLKAKVTDKAMQIKAWPWEDQEEEEFQSEGLKALLLWKI